MIRAARDRAKITDVIRILDPKHPEHRSSPEVRKLLLDPNLQTYLNSWALKPLRDLVKDHE